MNKQTKTKNRIEFYVRSFMYDLKLNKSVLWVYAALYSFTVGERGLYHGSAEYLACGLEISRRSVVRAYKTLFSLGLIEKYTSPDGRYKGVRCIRAAGGKGENTGAELIKEKVEFFEPCIEVGEERDSFEPCTDSDEECEPSESDLAKAEDKKSEEERTAEQTIEEHLSRVDDLCAKINAKIKSKNLCRPEPDFESAADSREGGVYGAEPPFSKMSEHEKNTFLMMKKYEKSGDNRRFMSFGKSGGVIMTEPQYRRLLELLPTEELMPYFVKLETMLTENVKTGRKPPHSHYKTLKKWIEEDLAL